MSDRHRSEPPQSLADEQNPKSLRRTEKANDEQEKGNRNGPRHVRRGFLSFLCFVPAIEDPRQYPAGRKWFLTAIVAGGGLVVPLSSGVLFRRSSLTTTAAGTAIDINDSLPHHDRRGSSHDRLRGEPVHRLWLSLRRHHTPLVVPPGRALRPTTSLPPLLLLSRPLQHPSRDQPQHRHVHLNAPPHRRRQRIPPGRQRRYHLRYVRRTRTRQSDGCVHARPDARAHVRAHYRRRPGHPVELAQHAVVHGDLWVGCVFHHGILHAGDGDESRRESAERASYVDKSDESCKSLAETRPGSYLAAVPAHPHHRVLHQHRLCNVLPHLRLYRRYLRPAAVLVELGHCRCGVYPRRAGPAVWRDHRRPLAGLYHETDSAGRGAL